MRKGKRSAPFERVLNEVEQKYLNFDGEGYEEDYDMEYDYAEGEEYDVHYDYADGSASMKPKLYQADPYQIVVENTSDRAQTAVLFGNDKHLLKQRFGNPSGIIVSIGQPGVDYVELLQESSTKPFSTQFIRIESNNELQLSKFLTIHKKGTNGNWFQRNINLQQFKSAYQNDRKMLDAPVEVKVNGSTYWEIEIEPNTRVFFTIFPMYKVDTSETLGGEQPIKSYAQAQVNTHGLLSPGQAVRPSVRPSVQATKPNVRPAVRPKLSIRR